MDCEPADLQQFKKNPVMRILYDIAIRSYWAGILLASAWNRKARLWLRGRRGWYKRLAGAFQKGEQVIWFHCASLGEFEQGRPLMEEIRKRMPGHRILLTFFSPSGYEKRKNFNGADQVMYLPLDTARNAVRFTGALSLKMAVFIKYEFWFHYLHTLKKEGIPLFLASGNFRRDQLFFKWYGGWYRKFLDCFTRIFVQDESSKKLLEDAGITSVSVAGDTRFDRVDRVVRTAFTHDALDAWTRQSRVIIAGSTWEKDVQLLEYAFQKLPQDIRWIIAPHEVDQVHLEHLRRHFPRAMYLTESGKGIPAGTRVVIVDTIGQLSYLYRYGTLAYIGGGFGKGIHNVLEAAAYGLPVIFGPRYEKFREAVELSGMGAAFPVPDKEGLLSTVCQQLENPNLLKTTSEKARKYVSERLGSTVFIIDNVCKISGAEPL